MSPSLRVLVTGSAGRIGRAAIRALKERGHFVRGFDLSLSDSADQCVVGNVTDQSVFTQGGPTE